MPSAVLDWVTVDESTVVRGHAYRLTRTIPVVDGYADPTSWFVPACKCGWSAASEPSEAAARAAHGQHKRRVVAEKVGC